MKRTIHYIALLLIVACSINERNYAQGDFEFRDVVTGIDTPWEILWGSDDHIWMTERYGRISRINPETGELKVLINLKDEVFEDGERGLMGMVLHPDFENNPYVYIGYNIGNSNNNTKIKIARLTYDGEKLGEMSVIRDDILGWWNHDGCRLWIDDDLTMFVTIGDRANKETAQNLESPNGKILRMNLDGTIPPDNPFPGSAIWSYGHRNPQGLVKANGILYSAEHGPSFNDELNIIIKGRNYGWPNVSGYCDNDEMEEESFCNEHNVVEPIRSWYPRGEGSTIAVCGIDYYNHGKFKEWDHSILSVALKNAYMVQSKLSDDGMSVVSEDIYFNNNFGRLRDLCIAPDGRLFLATSNKDGRGRNPFLGPEFDKIIEITPDPDVINSIEKKTKDTGLNIYPNPSNEGFYIESEKPVTVFDSFGKPVYESGENNFFWDGMSRNGEILSKGVYFAKSGGVVKKLIINGN